MADIITEEVEAVPQIEGKFIESLIEGVHASKKRYERLALEAAGGPEPANVENGFGAAEKREIKRYSRHPYGETIISTYVNGMSVLTICNENGDVSPLFSWWKKNSMDAKLKPVLKDAFTTGTGLLELVMEDNEVLTRVLSPKEAAVFSSDRVNQVYGDYAIQELHVDSNSPAWKLWDDTFYYVLYADKKRGRWSGRLKDLDWSVVEWGEHGFSQCPVIAFDDLVQSDNTVKSSIEVLEPVLKHIRLVTNAANEGTYWTGKKTMVIENVDRDQTRVDSETKDTVSLYEDIQDELQASDVNSAIMLPGSDSPGKASPKIAQLQETNLFQLDAMVKQAKNTLAGLSGIPLQRLDPAATPQTAEGSAQSHLALDGIIRSKQVMVDARVAAIYALVCEVTGWDYDASTYIVWAAPTPTSVSVVADTISKLQRLPIEWVVDVMLPQAGITPQQITALKEALKDQQDRMGALQSFLDGGQ